MAESPFLEFASPQKAGRASKPTVSTVAPLALPAWIAPAFDALDDAVVVVDGQWRILYANTRAVGDPLLNAEDLRGLSFWLAPLSLPTVQRRSYYEHIELARDVARFETPDEPTGRWLEVKASPMPGGGMVIQSRDVTTQRRALHALRENEEFHRSIAELTSDYAYRCVVNEDNTVCMKSVTEGFTRVTGYTLEEIRAQGDWPTLIHPDDLAGAIEHGKTILECRRSEYELRIITKSGEIRWIRYSTHPLRDPQTGRIARLVGAVQDITEDRLADDQLREYADRLKALSRRLLQVQEDERRHIARELHDEVGQLLTGLRLSLEATRRVPAGEVPDGLEQTLAIVRELTEKVRDISLALRPSMLDDLGLLPALLWHFERYTAQTGVKVAFDHTGLCGRLGTALETAAYRIVQEALTNVARHAEVKSATVRIHCGDGKLQIEVEDEGQGFQLSTVGRHSGGLSGMQERAELLGGTLHAEAAPGEGVRLRAELPLTE
jgi:PAS domain S-box-containing protein